MTDDRPESDRRSTDASEGRDGETTDTIRPEAIARFPKRIGHYHVKRVLASGGMGTVYEATQEKPRRVVAVKLMRQGIASRSAMRRFEYESQILARLRHPGIAQVYEAGTHRDDSGTVPFFAMEYIVGAEPITKYAKEKKLGTRERMTLFAQVCDAIHHGHQKGIIHRDLKPSNILVDATGQVKIIDFGVARSTDSDLAVTTLQTDIGQLIGTLQYMSPEQCKADPHDIDTRSDVYALGVVFYELLCGRLPYNVTRMAMHEATRIIREEQPTKLSTLNKTLRGDVETIALKALEKDRERRYQSATDFAQDIRRYLDNEAILARPPSVLYQFRVLVRRNKPIFGAIAAVFVVLIGATIVSTTLYVQTQREAEKSESTLQFLMDMLRIAGRRTADEKELSLRSILDDASARLDAGEFDHLPAVEARLRITLGETYNRLGMLGAARPHFERALEVCRQEAGEDHLATIYADRRAAYYLPPEEAEPRLRRNIERARRALGPTQKNTLHAMTGLAISLMKQGKVEEAEVIYREVLELDKKTAPANALAAATCLAAMLNDYFDDDDRRLAEAEALLRWVRSTLGPDMKDDLSWTETELSEVLMKRGRLEEAEELARQAFKERQRMYQPVHRQYAATWGNLVEILKRRGEAEEAKQMVTDYARAIDALIDMFHPAALRVVAWELLQCTGDGACDPEAAVRLAERAVGLMEREDPHILELLAPAAFLDTLALAYFKTGDTAKAVETQEEAVAILPPRESPRRAELEANLAKYRVALDDGE